MNELGCELQRCSRSRIWYYKCNTGEHAIAVHKPFGRASDSRDHVTMEDRFISGINVAILCNVERHFNGTPRLSEKDVLGNPVHAMYYFQYEMHAFHSSLRQAEAFYREAVKLDNSISPLIDNALRKTTDGAVPMGLRKFDRSLSRPPPRRLGKDDHRNVQTARAFFCSNELMKEHREEEDTAQHLSAVFDRLIEILLSGKGSDCDNLKKRFDSIVLELYPNSFYDNHLTNIWSHHRSNPGNKSTGPGKAISRLQILENNEALVEFFGHHGPQMGSRGRLSQRISNSTLLPFRNYWRLI